MRTSDVLAPLLDAGLSMHLVDGKVRVTPAELLTDDLRRHIRQHKPELLTLLAANDPHHPSGVIQYRLLSGGGGVLIDPDGIESAIQTLRIQYGDRLDWPALISTLQSMDAFAQMEAAKLINRLQKWDSKS